MSDHNFKAFDHVLVRDSDSDVWRARSFAIENNPKDEYRYGTTDGCGWAQCIPYNEDTKHLHGTMKPYEPPKPPHEYKWGDKVKVFEDGGWWDGIVALTGAGTAAVVRRGKIHAVIYTEKNIKPLEG